MEISMELFSKVCRREIFSSKDRRNMDLKAFQETAITL